MKKIFCLIAAFSALLPLALSAQEFNPARGPLEGVWEMADEDIIIFTGNLMLKGEKDGGSFYDIMPGMVYRNGQAFGSAGYDIMFDYELSGNTLKIFMEDAALICTKSRNDILRNKGPLEGIWKGGFSKSSDTTATIVWIITGGLLIEAAETGFSTEYEGGLEFIYSEADDTLIGLGETISCVVSGDTMIITNDSRTAVLTRER
jgi:hypothetical protein